MAINEKNNYFTMIYEMVELSNQAAESLNETLNAFDVAKLPDTMAYLHNIEHSADLKKHDTMKRLVREFITPIEREDIIQLAQEIDNVTDSIEDVLIKIHMYNVGELRPEALRFSDVIVRCTATLMKICAEFHSFRKSTSIHANIVEVNRLEEVGDRIYSEAMCRLFRETQNPVELLIWQDMFGLFEGCCDACEHVSDVIESVIMKNS